MSQKNQSGGQERNIRQVADEFTKKGWRTVRLRPNSKVPVSGAWQNADPRPEEFKDADNVGVQLGVKSNHLVDIDFDSPEARALSGLRCFFGAAPSFHRSSLPESEPGHRLVICTDAPDKVEKFAFSRAAEKAAIESLQLPKSVILELRAGKGFTVFPPSVINDDPLIWGGLQEPL